MIIDHNPWQMSIYWGTHPLPDKFTEISELQNFNLNSSMHEFESSMIISLWIIMLRRAYRTIYTYHFKVFQYKFYIA